MYPLDMPMVVAPPTRRSRVVMARGAQSRDALPEGSMDGFTPARDMTTVITLLVGSFSSKTPCTAGSRVVH
jgi:hypothetical protein